MSVPLTEAVGPDLEGRQRQGTGRGASSQAADRSGRGRGRGRGRARGQVCIFGVMLKLELQDVKVKKRRVE